MLCTVQCIVIHSVYIGKSYTYRARFTKKLTLTFEHVKNL